MPLLKSPSRAAHSAPTPTDIAYAAGIIDGEGSISAIGSFHCIKNFRVEVKVGMCDPEVVDFLGDTFGGSVRKAKRTTNSGKPIYSWSLYCRNASWFLSLILPYLKIKHQRAADAILLASLMRTRSSAQTSVISSEEIAVRTEIAARIKAANIAHNGRLSRYAT